MADGDGMVAIAGYRAVSKHWLELSSDYQVFRLYFSWKLVEIWEVM